MGKSNPDAMEYQMDSTREERKKRKLEQKQQKQEKQRQASNAHVQPVFQNPPWVYQPVQSPQWQKPQKQYQPSQSQQGSVQKNSKPNIEQATQKEKYKTENKQTSNQQQTTFETRLTSTPYCSGCNEVGHTPLQCVVQKAVQSIYSAIRCTLCDEKGHTKDQCNNPNVRKCRNCCRPGHSTSDCRLRGFNQAYRPLGGTKMEWKLPDWEGNNQPHAPLAHQVPVQRDGQGDIIMGETTKQPYSFRAVPIAKSTSQTNNINTNNAGQPSMDEISAKIAHSRSLYPKIWANWLFERFEPEFHKLLPLSTLCAVRGRLNAGFNFYRDPEAMMALAMRLRPQCWTCGKFGHILDWTLRGIAEDVDVLKVEDDAHWGIVVYFECSCCKSGYRYEPMCCSV